MKNFFLLVRLLTAVVVALALVGFAFQLARVGLKVKPRPPAETATTGEPAKPSGK